MKPTPTYFIRACYSWLLGWLLSLLVGKFVFFTTKAFATLDLGRDTSIFATIFSVAVFLCISGNGAISVKIRRGVISGITLLLTAVLVSFGFSHWHQHYSYSASPEFFDLLLISAFLSIPTAALITIILTVTVEKKLSKQTLQPTPAEGAQGK